MAGLTLAQEIKILKEKLIDLESRPISFSSIRSISARINGLKAKIIELERKLSSQNSR